MSDEMILRVMPMVVSASIVLLTLGMVFAYMTLRLIVKSKREPKVEKPRKKATAPYHPDEHPDMETLLARCSDLTQRLAVLEEIMREEKTEKLKV